MKYLHYKKWFTALAVTAALMMSAFGSTAVSAAEVTANETKDASETEDADNETVDASEEKDADNETVDASETEENGILDVSEEEDTEEETAYTPATIAAVDTLDLEDMFSDKDLNDSWDEQTAEKIELKGTSAETKAEGVTVDGTTVTISKAGTYVLSGTLEDGQIIVEADKEDKVQLVLNGVSVTNDDSACIFVRSADKVIITLADGTENTLSDTGAEYVQTDEGSTVDGVIFSRDDLSLNGSGSLTVRAGWKHGIVSKDDLVITGGTYTVTASGKGLVGEDSIHIKEGEFTVDSGDDAFHSDTNDKEGKGYIYIEDGTFTITAGDDGIHAATALIIANGTITIEDSYEGLEGATIDILDGDIQITAGDDALNAAYSSADSDEEIEWDNGGMNRHGEGSFGNKGEMTPPDMPEDAEDPDLPEDREDCEFPYDMEGVEWPEDMEGVEWPEDWEDIGSLYDAADKASLYDVEDSDYVEDMQYPEDTEYPEDMGGRGHRGGNFPGGGFPGGDFRDGDFPGGSFPGGVFPGGDFQDSDLPDFDFRDSDFPDIDFQGGDFPDNGFQGGFGGMMDPQSDAYLRISGGTIYVNAGGDGLDSNGYLYVEGGTILVDGPTNDGNGALDYGIDAVISGGTILASGSAGMAESFGNDSTQYSLSYTFDSEVSAGTAVVLTDEDGKEIFSASPAKVYRNVVISTPELKEGTYTITAGDQSETVTIDRISSSAGASSGMGFGGMRPGGGGGRPGSGFGGPSSAQDQEASEEESKAI